MSSRSSKAKILSTSITALSAALASQALAADAGVTVAATAPFASVVVGSVVSGDGLPQENIANVTAGVTGSTLTTTVSGASNGSFVNSGNTADALAQGNINTVTTSLATISSALAGSDGIGIATVSRNTGAITATASGQTAGATMTGFTAGSVEVARNSIDATTSINSGTTTLTNAIPVGYSNTAGGPATAVIGSTTAAIDADGTLVLANAQSTQGANSAAIASGNTASLNLLSGAGNNVIGSAVLDSNNVGATFTGNSRTSSIGIAADTASFAGTAVITNTQYFDGNTVSGDNAQNTGSLIAATVQSAQGVTPGAANVLSGSSLSVNSNQITTAASGNVLAGSITLANALSYDSAGTALASARTDVFTSGALVDAAGGLTIASNQVSADFTANAFLNATTSGAAVTATVQESVGSSVTLSGNRVTAAVTGNSLDTSISSGVGSALIDTSATLASRQQNGAGGNFGFDLTANALNSTIAVVLGDTDNGTLSGGSGTMAGNIIAASAIGSQATQDITLEAANLPNLLSITLAADAAPTAGGAGLSATGAGAIVTTSFQENLDSAVAANSTGNAISLTSNDDDGVTSGTNLTVSGSIQQAFAMGGTVANSIDLTAGANMKAGVGIANSQTSTAGSTVTATQTGTVTLAVTESAGGGASAPSLTLTGNRSEALATGFAANNSLDVDANSVTLVAFGTAGAPLSAPVPPLDIFDAVANLAGGGLTLDTASSIATSTSSFGVLNRQSILDNVTASAAPIINAAAFTVSVGDDTVAASVTNDANRLTAQAQGVTATNALALDAGSAAIGFGPATFPAIVVSTASTVATVMNLQLVDANVSATAAPSGTAATVLTRLGNAAGDDLSNAAVSTSGNRVTAIADGAVASNTLNASTGTMQIFDGPASNPLATNQDAGLASVSGSVLTANAALAMINRQAFTSNDAVTATLRQADSDRITDSALLLTSVAGGVSGSGIVSTGNQLTALASSLEAANSLSLDGTTLRTTGALLNSQESGAQTNALIGYAGTPPTPGTPPVPVSNSGTGSIPTSGLGISGSNLTNNTAGPITITLTSALNAAQAAFLSSLGFTGATVGGTTLTIAAGATVNTAPFNSFNTSGSGGTTSITFTGFTLPGIPASGGSPNAGGVVVTVGGDISGSSISVASNSVTGQALGNTGSNSLSVSATSLDADGANLNGAAGLSSADADYALASVQTVNSGSASNAQVFATFAIDQTLATAPANQAITNATLAVDGNAQVAEAMANNVTNTLSVSATDMGVLAAPSAALSNLQSGLANVDAVSDMEAYANIQSSGSTISIDGNSNRAIGVVNNAANSLTVGGTTIAGTGANASVSLVSADTSAVGSFALNNSQTVAANSALDTSAESSIFNTDLTDTASTGLVNGSVSMANNLTFAESSANRASNSVTVAGGASNAAPAALANDQASAAAVTALAASTVGASLTGTDAATDLEAADGSALSIAGNTTQALARGNTATNTMVFTAGADFGTVATGANVNTVPGTSAGAAAMLNRQDNSGSVGATATANYQVVLNSGGSAPAAAAVLNSAVSVSGNTVAAQAFGNQATNRMELAVLNSGNATAAFNNVQSNTGVITATASNVTFSSSVAGTVSNGAFRNVGNAASATAVGNSTLTSIVGR